MSFDPNKIFKERPKNNLYAEVEDVVIRYVQHLRSKGVDTDTCNYLFNKFSNLGASLVDCARLFSTQPSLPLDLTIRIVEKINEIDFTK